MSKESLVEMSDELFGNKEQLLLYPQDIHILKQAFSRPLLHPSFRLMQHEKVISCKLSLVARVLCGNCPGEGVVWSYYGTSRWVACGVLQEEHVVYRRRGWSKLPDLYINPGIDDAHLPSYKAISGHHWFR